MLLKSSFALILVLALNTTRATRVKFYTTRSCDGAASYEFRDNDCNKCYDPPFDWFASEITEIGPNQRVSAHNQDGCTPKSAVGQSYGPQCRIAGATAVRSVWVSCDGRKFDALNITELNDSSPVPTAVADDA